MGEASMRKWLRRAWCAMGARRMPWLSKAEEFRRTALHMRLQERRRRAFGRGGSDGVLLFAGIDPVPTVLHA